MLQEAVHAHAGQQLPLRRQRDLVLHERAKAALGFARADARPQSRSRLSIDRIEDVDRIRRRSARVGAVHHRVVAEVVEIRAGHQRVLDRTGMHIALHVDAASQIVGVVIALTRLAPQRAAVGQQARRIRRFAEQRRRPVRQPRVQLPALVELMFRGQLMALRAHRRIAIPRLTQKARIGQRTQLLVDGDDAPVERRLQLRRFKRIRHHRIVRRQPRERRRNHIAPAR